MQVTFRKYRKTDRGKIQDILIDKRHLNKYTSKALPYKIAFLLGIYRPYIYLIEEKETREIIAIGVLVKKVDHSFQRRHWWIEGIRVTEKQKRLGWGTQLMKNLLYKAKKKGAKKIFLNIEADNLTAQSFFRKLNFKPIARIFSFIKPPFTSVHYYFPPNRLTINPLKKTDLPSQAIISFADSDSDKLIDFYRKLFTIFRLITTKTEEGITPAGFFFSITSIYYFFQVRIKVILGDISPRSELEKIVLYEFSKFLLGYWRKILVDVIIPNDNPGGMDFFPALPKLSSVEGLMVFEYYRIEDNK